MFCLCANINIALLKPMSKEEASRDKCAKNGQSG